MNNARFVVFDTETGGLEAKDTSLLTAYFGILDPSLNVIAELDLALKPESGVYGVTAGALKVNKINLVEHEKSAVPYPQAAIALARLLKEYSNPKSKLIPIAHNIPFDYSFVFDKLLEKHVWEEFCSYRAIDTMGIALYLALQGKLPIENLKLERIAQLLGVQAVGELHRAKTDALLCKEVLRKMLTM